MAFSTVGVPVRPSPHGELGSPSADQSSSDDSAALLAGTPVNQGISTQTAGEFQDFGLVSTTDGWILLGGRLYWTRSNGENWNDITPPLPSTATIYAVKFLDAQSGWVLWANGDASGDLVFEISTTSDQGADWNATPVQTITPDNPDIEVENASMGWLGGNFGWVSLKRPSGSNFSSGTLFRTDDSGQTWARFSLPIGGPVYFVDSQVGWMAGGPAGDQLFKTLDGGQTWEQESLPAGIDASQSVSLYPPIFDSPDNGLLAVITLNGDSFQVGFYSTADGGQDWASVASLPLGSQVGTLPLSLLDSQDLVAAVPNGDRIFHMDHGAVTTLPNHDGMSAAIVDMVMVSSDSGWAKWNTSNCAKQAAPDANGSSNITCTSVTKLIKTSDGGGTWQTIPFPNIGSDSLTQNTTSTYSGLSQMNAASAGNTRLIKGQGFDACTVPTLAQLEGWSDDSPYGSVNLYIGGAARACANTALTTSFLNQVAQQNWWTFIPTWVGPQAPCTTFTKRFSSDVNTAYNDGVNEANLAVEALASFGLTSPDKTGSIVYYDLETYIGDQSCRDAVKSFMNGWVTELHLRGNLAGVYGSTGCTNGLNNFLQIANIPDAIWPAIWDHAVGQGSYNPAATVWTAGCITSSSWSNHQRIRQYEGDHSETWGTVSIGGIDNDVLDGVVAVPYSAGTPSANFYASPLSGTAPLTVTFNIVNTIYMTSCLWNYGDGQTGTSCAASHSHIYANAGTYTVSLTAVGPGGSNSLTRSNYITASQTPPPSLPDLVPYPRNGRLNPVVISSVTGTSTDGTLYAGLPIYIDWGFKNIGTVGVTTIFKADIYIDDQRIIDSSFAGLGSGVIGGYDDIVFTWNTPGWHTVKLVVDPEYNVPESNENNNIWTGQFYWESTVPTTGVTTISPTGTISNNTNPPYIWNAVTTAILYQLYVYSLGSASNVLSLASIQPGSVCDYVSLICTYNAPILLSPGDYQFKVIAKINSSTSASSPWMTFTVGGAPSAPVSVTPVGTITEATPSFTWTKSDAASWYELNVYPAGSSVAVISATSIPASSNCSTAACTWTASARLPRGDYQFNVRAYNLSGASDFSAWVFFTVNVDTTTYWIYIPLLTR